MRMRVIAIATPILATAVYWHAVTPAAAIWCARYNSGANNCGFYNQQQCLETVRGIGGYCTNEGGDDEARKARQSERKAESKPKPKPKPEPEAKEKPKPAVAAPPPAAQPAAPPPAAQQGPATFQSAQALILAGNYDAGIAAMKSLGYDDHPDIANMIGYAYNKLGRRDEARRWYTRALAADPNHLGALSSSGALYLVQGDVAKARAELARIQTVCGGTACREYQALAALIAAGGR